MKSKEKKNNKKVKENFIQSKKIQKIIITKKKN